MPQCREAEEGRGRAVDRHAHGTRPHLDLALGRIRDFVREGAAGVPALKSKPAIMIEGMLDRAIPPELAKALEAAADVPVDIDPISAFPEPMR